MVASKREITSKKIDVSDFWFCAEGGRLQKVRPYNGVKEKQNQEKPNRGKKSKPRTS